jgi:hypothetical protein
MAIAAGLSAIKTGFGLIKSAVELLKRETVDVHEVQARLIELQGLMLDARSALVDAEEENRSLKRALEDRDDAKKLAEDMEFQNDGGFYVRKSEAGKGLIAYCPLCWQKDHLTVPLETVRAPGSFKCSLHETFYETAEHREAAKRRAESRPTSRNWRHLSDE